MPKQSAEVDTFLDREDDKNRSVISGDGTFCKQDQLKINDFYAHEYTEYHRVDLQADSMRSGSPHLPTMSKETDLYKYLHT